MEVKEYICQKIYIKTSLKCSNIGNVVLPSTSLLPYSQQFLSLYQLGDVSSWCQGQVPGSGSGHTPFNMTREGELLRNVQSLHKTHSTSWIPLKGLHKPRSLSETCRSAWHSLQNVNNSPMNSSAMDWTVLPPPPQLICWDPHLQCDGPLEINRVLMILLIR